MPIVAAQLVTEVTTQGIDQAKSELNSMGGFVDGIGSRFKAGLGGALSLAAGAAGAALGFLKNQFVDCIKVATDHEMVLAQTVQALKSTRDASGMTASAINDFARSLSETTPFAEDTVQSGENLLLTFTGIGKQVFPEATQAMLDMAQAMHQGPQQGAIMLGKALNDPLTGLTALTRVGVTFSDEEKKQIKTMMAHNDIIGAQKVMLHELETEFGGSAKAAGQTFGGQMQILSNRMENFKEEVGMAVLPILSQLVGYLSSAVGPMLDALGQALQSPAFQSFASGVGTAILDVFKGIGWAVQFVYDVFRSLNLTDFKDAWRAVSDELAYAARVLGGLFTSLKPVGDALEPLANLIAGPMKGALSFVTGLLWDFSAAFSTVAGGLQGGKSIGDALLSLFPPPLQSAIRAVAGLFHTLADVWTHDIAPALASLTPAFASLGQSLSGGFAQAVEEVSRTLSGQFISNMKFLGDTARSLGTWFKNDVAPAIKEALPGFQHLANVLLTDVVPALAELWTIGQQVVQHIIKAFLPVFEKAEPILIRIAGIVSEGLAQALHFLMPYIIQAAEAIGKFAGEIADRVAPILMHFWDSIQKGLDWLQANWKYIWPSLSLILKGVWDEISGIVQIAWAIVSGIIKVGLDLISGNWGQAWTDIKDMFSGIWNGIVTLLRGMVETISGVISGWVTAIVGFFQGLYDAVVGHSIIPDMINGILSWFGQLPGRAMGFIHDLISQLTQTLGNLGSQALGWAEDMMQGFINGITGMLGNLGSTVQNVAGTIAQFLHFSKPDVGPLADVERWMPDFTDLLSQGLTSGIPKLQGALTSLTAPIALSLHPTTSGTGSGGGGIGASAMPAVFPSSASSSGMGGGGGVIEIHVHNSIDGRELTDHIGNGIMRQVRITQGRRAQ